MQSFQHSGLQERSGRYRWGEGLVPYQRLRREGKLPWGEVEDPFSSEEKFSSAISYFKSKGYTEKEIADDLGVKTSNLRNILSLNKQATVARNVSMANSLKDRGYSEDGIAKRMKVPASTVRDWLKPRTDRQYQILEATTNALKESVKERVYLDVGLGVETQFGVKRTKLDLAIQKLIGEGYQLHHIRIKQVGTGKNTKYKILTPPGVTKTELLLNRDKIGLPIQYSNDGGVSYLRIAKPVPLELDRIEVVYNGEGGELKDGVIEIRPGRKDLSLGKNHYAQVRIQVGPKHFIKGVAVYNNELPRGVDVRFNTSKKRTDNKTDAMKPLKDDEGNPFGARIVRQVEYEEGGKKKQSPLNLVAEEGSWDEWSNRLSSQFLSKQSTKLARQQLGLALKHQEEKLDEILSVGNVEVKRHLLRNFAESADTAARELKAAPLAGQSQAIILPILSLKENEIYAPKYQDGERVVLIRHPHGGTFELPTLIVNNKNKEARGILGSGTDKQGMAKDAVGIHPNTAKILSGADYDGDSVIVIPNRDGAIKTHPAFDALLNFDNKTSYPYYEGMKVITEHRKQIEMGIVSNLITDMTLKGATASEIVRAVRHSMVVIDAEKHKLNYKQSEIDHGIQDLKDKYQDGGGSSTLISRAKSTVWVPERKRAIVDKETGKLSWVQSNRKYRFKDDDGERVVEALQPSTQMDEADDARALSSGTYMEEIYAGYANALKRMAEKARATAENLETQKVNAHNKAAQQKAVESLLSKVNIILVAKPHERRAQLLANKTINEEKEKNPDLSFDKDKMKKLRGHALVDARLRVGYKRPVLNLTEEEWHAIETGAVSANVINTILLALEPNIIRERFMPKTSREIKPNVKNRAKSLLLSGDYTYAEIANMLGISVSSVVRIAGGD